MKTIKPLAVVALLSSIAMGQSFTFTDFSTIAGLMNLNGSATQVGNVLRLTANASNQTAGAWRSQQFPVVNGFDTTFHFRITPPAVGTKAEGMAFVIHNAASGASTLGGAVWGIGYGPGSNGASIVNSLALELDTFQDGFLSDTSSNELTIHTNGVGANNENEAFSIGRVTPATNLSNGQIHALRFRYVPGTLEVYADNLVTPVLTVPYNFTTGGNFVSGGGAVGGLNLPSGSAWLGFTATTGAGTLTELVEILDWTWSSTPLVDSCYFGQVQATSGTPMNVLSVNGSAGNFSRIVDVATFQPITIDVLQPTMTPTPSPFALLVVGGRPSGAAATTIPFVGSICFPVNVPLPSDVFLVADTLGTGLTPIAGSTPAPWSLSLMNGLPIPAVVTLQGIIFDATAPTQLSTTNAVTLNVFTAPAPTITNLTPNSAVAGGTITVTGTNFRPGLALAINGVPVTPTTVSSTTITFPYPGGTPCGATLTVTNLDGQSASRAINPQPTISNLINPQGSANGGLLFVITGSGFAPGTTVTIGGNPATVNTASNNVVSVTTPAGMVGPRPVVITTPGGCVVNATYTYL